MTDSKMEALARQLVASKHWRWLPGMRTIGGDRVLDIRPMPDAHGDWIERVHRGQVSGLRVCWFDELPDLTDAATLGCLLQLVREAWTCDEWRRVTIEPAGAGWCVVVRNGRHRPPSRSTPGWDLERHAHPRYRDVSSPLGSNEFASEAEALAAALLAAPEAS